MSEGRTRSKTVALSTVIAGVLVAGMWLIQRAGAATSSMVNGPELLSEVTRHVRDDYVDSVGDESINRLTIDGVLSQLNDPYDAYLTPDRLAFISERTSGSYAGIGLQVDVRDGSVVVVNPVSNAPGERAGILTGDRIAQVDGKQLSGFSSEEVQRMLRGAPGSKVSLTIEHSGSASATTIELTRAPIHQSAVKRSAMLAPGIAYVALSVFSDSTARELTNTVDSLTHAGATSLVLDLRANPGGLLDQGVGVADLFLDKGRRIASTRGRDSASNIVYTDSAEQRWPALRLAVLVDDKTASAAEIVAGALQDNDRAAVIGDTTYGKGSVQHIFKASAGAVRLTTARWATPLGRVISRSYKPGGVADTTKRPSFKTAAGRTVIGGGGITPDVTTGDSAAPSVNLAFMRAVGPHVAAFHDALTGLALELKAKRSITSPSFVVTPAMRDEIYKRMQDRKVDVPRGTYDDAAPLVSRLFAYELDRYVFGAEAEFRRKAADDKSLLAAQSLLQASTSQADALARAGDLQRSRHE